MNPLISPLEGWENFFVAEAGAAAALAGLVFVAVSINLTRILEFPQLPPRAAETLVSLILVLFVATFALIPGQSAKTCGLEIGITGLATWVLLTAVMLRGKVLGIPWFMVRVLLNQLPGIPFTIAGALLFLGVPGAMYWVVPGTLLSFVAGVFGAWVLLIEIQR